jgi:hypothetical protein
MPQIERAEENRARLIVERLLGISLEFADLTGGVDFTFRRNEKHGVLEVSRITQQKRREGFRAWEASEKSVFAMSLRRSWLVMADGNPRIKGIWESLEFALGQLEMHHLERYGESMDWWLRHVPTLERPLKILQSKRIRAAYAIPNDVRADSETGPRIHLSLSGVWMSGGPEDAVSELNSVLSLPLYRSKCAKLKASGVIEQHLWLWVDSFTEERLRDPVCDRDGHLALPTTSPELPAHISHLWLVDDHEQHGWLWTRGGGWSWVNRDSD